MDIMFFYDKLIKLKGKAMVESIEFCNLKNFDFNPIEISEFERNLYHYSFLQGFMNAIDKIIENLREK